MGIEPTLAAWEAAVLPLNYTRGAGVFYLKSYSAVAANLTKWLFEVDAK